MLFLTSEQRVLSDDDGDAHVLPAVRDPDVGRSSVSPLPGHSEPLFLQTSGTGPEVSPNRAGARYREIQRRATSD